MCPTTSSKKRKPRRKRRKRPKSNFKPLRGKIPLNNT